MIVGFWQRESPQPYVHIGIVAPGLGSQAALVPFMVDTGAAVTVIHAFDAIHSLNMSLADLNSELWPDVVDLGGVGGSAKYRPISAELLFFHRENPNHFERFDSQIYLGDSHTEMLPSLLGRDVMRNFELVVRGESRITLERI